MNRLTSLGLHIAVVELISQHGLLTDNETKTGQRIIRHVTEKKIKFLLCKLQMQIKQNMSKNWGLSPQVHPQSLLFIFLIKKRNFSSHPSII